jgi:hypothetical protein
MTSSVHSYQMMVDKQSEQLKVKGRIPKKIIFLFLNICHRSFLRKCENLLYGIEMKSFSFRDFLFLRMIFFGKYL